jgi:hypothetical protein
LVCSLKLAAAEESCSVPRFLKPLTKRIIVDKVGRLQEPTGTFSSNTLLLLSSVALLASYQTIPVKIPLAHNPTQLLTWQATTIVYNVFLHPLRYNTLLQSEPKSSGWPEMPNRASFPRPSTTRSTPSLPSGMEKLEK